MSVTLREAYRLDEEGKRAWVHNYRHPFHTLYVS